MAASWGEAHRDRCGSMASSGRPAGCVLTGITPTLDHATAAELLGDCPFSLRGEGPPQGSFWPHADLTAGQPLAPADPSRALHWETSAWHSQGRRA